MADLTPAVLLAMPRGLEGRRELKLLIEASFRIARWGGTTSSAVGPSPQAHPHGGIRSQPESSSTILAPVRCPTWGTFARNGRSQSTEGR
jgi:hypothetical protein